MPSQAPVTLRDCLERGVVLSWSEAVAVLVEVVGQVRRSGGALVTPDPDHVVVMPDGELTILTGCPIPAHPVVQAAKLLDRLLKGTPAPTGLCDLITQNLRIPPACTWIEEFVTALSYYERPGSRQILAALAERAALARPSQP